MYNTNISSIYKRFEKYDELVTEYPKEIFEDIDNYTHLEENSTILEIGSGTGKATKEILELNHKNITCIEIEYELASYMDKKFNRDINIDISSFEEWQNPVYKYDIVICANSFHLLTPEIRINKIKKVLKKDGVVALFCTFGQISNKKLQKEIDKIYKKLNFNLYSYTYENFKNNISNIQDEIMDEDTFYDFKIKKYKWNKIYSVDQYIDMLNINDVHCLLDEDTKYLLNNIIKDKLKQNNIKIEYHAILFLTKLF